ncbi:hypothetical protein HJG60_012131 [Phyllostomus discolor]|uniref:Uncharacterized protein n=1 Tax=Phyllostomus discolor TaxID=89673 RepID=A0A834DWR9_9CHIR|nr:hypothetical protein HJG60_012131 [Phyllostomus discolor]
MFCSLSFLFFTLTLYLHFYWTGLIFHVFCGGQFFVSLCNRIYKTHTRDYCMLYYNELIHGIMKSEKSRTSGDTREPWRYFQSALESEGEGRCSSQKTVRRREGILSQTCILFMLPTDWMGPNPDGENILLCIFI